MNIKKVDHIKTIYFVIKLLTSGAQYGLGRGRGRAFPSVGWSLLVLMYILCPFSPVAEPTALKTTRPVTIQSLFPHRLSISLIPFSEERGDTLSHTRSYLDQS